MKRKLGAVAMLAPVSAATIAAPVVDTTATSPVTNVSREQLENLPTGRRLEDLIRTCPASTIPTMTTQPQILIDGRPTTPGNSIDCVKPDDVRMIEVYKLHNDVRFEVGSRPLVWDPLLAAQAQSYGPELAQHGRPVHSSRVGRETSRENLLQALPGTSAGAMVGVWTGERKNFVNGVFPNVSLTGNWADVGHYSQMIWPTTTNLGCAIHTGGQFDWLICRYSPPGNKDGKMVLAEREEPPPPPPTTGGRILHPSGIPQPTKPARDPCSDDLKGLIQAQEAEYQRQQSGRAGDDGITPDDSLGYSGEADTLAMLARIGQAPAPKRATPTPPPESILDDVGENSPPPESILDDVGEGSAGPPPESILDDVGEGSAGPPPESILDDVGDSQTTQRETPPPPPKSEKGKAVHDTPMAQPHGPPGPASTAKPKATDPRPTAADPAPGGNEEHHPLAVYFGNAWKRHFAATCGRGNPQDGRQAIDDMDYALDELRKRMKAASQAGSFSTVNPDEVKKVIDSLEGAAEHEKMLDREAGD